VAGPRTALPPLLRPTSFRIRPVKIRQLMRLSGAFIFFPKISLDICEFHCAFEVRIDPEGLAGEPAALNIGPERLDDWKVNNRG
jgi:hypothetical protein